MYCRFISTLRSISLATDICTDFCKNNKDVNFPHFSQEDKKNCTVNKGAGVLLNLQASEKV